MPVLAWCTLAAFTVQWLVFVPSWLAHTEHFYDLTGSVTFVTALGLAMALHPPDARALLIAALIAVWAVRLGTFLFRRVRRDRFDRRFTALKRSFPMFLMTWTLQGLWVVMSTAAGLTAMTSVARVPLGTFALVGAALWLAGFAVEAVADNQKRAFRTNPANADAFIRSGLWARARHPNYFGEILLWCGIAVIALPALSGWQWLTLISPVFITVLLVRISGVALLEARARKKWGDDPAYAEYRKHTPMLLPLGPR